MEGISPFQSGRPLLSEITADKLNRILSEIKRNRPVVAAPLSARVTGDGTHISIRVPPGGTSTPTETHPFQITSFADPESNSESPSYLVTVQPGTINNILPSNVFDGGIGLTEFAAPANALRYVCLSATSNDGSISSCTLSVDTSVPTQQTALANSLPASFKVLLGVVYNGTVKQIATDNLRAYGIILFNTYDGTQNRNWYVWTWSNA
jgi:hypothetical protein